MTCLLSDGALVHSPLYGPVSASVFFPELFNDTAEPGNASFRAQNNHSESAPTDILGTQQEAPNGGYTRGLGQ
jgi:hypothetical protein